MPCANRGSVCAVVIINGAENFVFNTLQFQMIVVRREFPCRAGIGQYRPNQRFIEG
jgi:hypothetical protein